MECRQGQTARKIRRVSLFIEIIKIVIIRMKSEISLKYEYGSSLKQITEANIKIN